MLELDGGNVKLYNFRKGPQFLEKSIIHQSYDLAIPPLFTQKKKEHMFHSNIFTAVFVVALLKAA